VEGVLLAQYRLAAAGDTDDQVDRVAQQAPVENLVEPLVSARQPLDQGATS
jgi:hypothetical protein